MQAGIHNHAEHLHTASEAGTPPAVSDNALYAGVLSGIYRDSKYIFPGIQAVSNWAKLHFTRNRFGVRNDFRSLFYRIHLCQVTDSPLSAGIPSLSRMYSIRSSM